MNQTSSASVVPLSYYRTNTKGTKPSGHHYSSNQMKIQLKNVLRILAKKPMTCHWITLSVAVLWGLKPFWEHGLLGEGGAVKKAPPSLQEELLGDAGWTQARQALSTKASSILFSSIIQKREMNRHNFLQNLELSFMSFCFLAYKWLTMPQALVEFLMNCRKWL